MKRFGVPALVLLLFAVAVASATAKAPFGGVYQTTVRGQVEALNGAWLLSFTPNGGYTVTKKPSSTRLIGGTATVSGRTIVFRDRAGPLSCTGSATSGTYTWALSGKTLALRILKDPCPGRPLILAGGTFTKVR